MGKPRRAPKLRSHGAASAAAFAVVLVLSVGVIASSQVADLLLPTSEVGVEHTKPLSIAFDVGTLHGVAVIDVLTESDETVFLSVPSSWNEREVRNVPIAAVTSDASTFGFTRWTLPPSAGISFSVPSDPGRILLHNPSGVPVKAAIRRVNLDDGTVEDDIVLVLQGSGEL